MAEQVHSIVQRLCRPEFLWRPRQLLRRLAYKPSSTIEQLPLPWNCTISACSAEDIGKWIAAFGLYDLLVTEAIIRLADPGDIAVDVGANIGYTALVLAMSARREGRVHCFEPNPHVLPNLLRNVNDWSKQPIAQIKVESIALSDHDGEAMLGFPDGYSVDQSSFVGNQGLASLEQTQNGVPVPVRKLDSFAIGDIGIMKVDVEGHEAAVFSGGSQHLAAKKIRDILFEEHEVYPARSHRLLLDEGYSLFRVCGSTFGPQLLQPQTRFLKPSVSTLYPPNFLATISPERAQRRFSRRGWRALSSKP